MRQIDIRIAQANGRLKAGRVGIYIERLNNRLYLRATLPPKPNSQKQQPHQQRIALRYHANPAGVKEAEAAARLISVQVIEKQFNWAEWGYSSDEPQTTREWIEKFEQDYFSRRARTNKAETTWKTDYRVILKRLPDDRPLTAELLLEVVEDTKPDTKTRRRACMVLQQLSCLAGIELDLKPYRGRYSPSQVEPRNLPTDEQIAEWFYRIPNPNWQWVYGVLATYGIRPHEVFQCELNNFPILSVLDGKTGARQVWPCYPEWAESFDLVQGKAPKCTGTNAELGHRVATAFRRYGVPFPAYALRHCWAIRTIRFRWPDSMAAQQQGHSVAVHTEIYHRWITAEYHQEMFELLAMRTDRPIAPLIDVPASS